MKLLQIDLEERKMAHFLWLGKKREKSLEKKRECEFKTKI